MNTLMIFIDESEDESDIAVTLHFCFVGGCL